MDVVFVALALALGWPGLLGGTLAAGCALADGADARAPTAGTVPLAGVAPAAADRSPAGTGGTAGPPTHRRGGSHGADRRRSPATLPSLPGATVPAEAGKHGPLPVPTSAATGLSYRTRPGILVDHPKEEEKDEGEQKEDQIGERDEGEKNQTRERDEEEEYQTEDGEEEEKKDNLTREREEEEKEGTETEEMEEEQENQAEEREEEGQEEQNQAGEMEEEENQEEEDQTGTREEEDNEEGEEIPAWERQENEEMFQSGEREEKEQNQAQESEAEEEKEVEDREEEEDDRQKEEETQEGEEEDGDESEPLVDGLPARERAYRVALLRRKLMDQLGLDDLTPPATDQPPRPLPREIMKRLVRKPTTRPETVHEEPAKNLVTEVVSYAMNDSESCPDSGLCFLFQLVDDVLATPLRSITLWLYLTPSLNHSPVRQVSVWLLPARSGLPGPQREELAQKVLSKREGWFSVKLPADRLASPEYRLQVVEVTARPAGGHAGPHSPTGDPASLAPLPVSLAADRLPILTVAVDVDRLRRRGGRSGAGRRHRRRRTAGTRCGPAPRICCLHNFYVGLDELLGGRVVSPDRVLASFCRGGCRDAVNYQTAHAQFMRAQAANETDPELRADMMPCCVPLSYNPARSFVIRRQDNTVVQTSISQIEASSCGCV